MALGISGDLRVIMCRQVSSWSRLYWWAMLKEKLMLSTRQLPVQLCHVYIMHVRIHILKNVPQQLW